MEINCSLKLRSYSPFQSNKTFDQYLKTIKITIKEQQNVPFLSKQLNSFIHRNMYETDYTALELMAQYCYSWTTETVWTSIVTCSNNEGHNGEVWKIKMIKIRTKSSNV